MIVADRSRKAVALGLAKKAVGTRKSENDITLLVVST